MLPKISLTLSMMTAYDYEKKEITDKISAWLVQNGWVLMDDGTYHYDWGRMRVQFKKNVVRIDNYQDWQKPSDRWPGDKWKRMFSAHYSKITFEENGVPRGLGFQSYPPLRRTWNNESN